VWLNCCFGSINFFIIDQIGGNKDGYALKNITEATSMSPLNEIHFGLNGELHVGKGIFHLLSAFGGNGTDFPKYISALVEMLTVDYAVQVTLERESVELLWVSDNSSLETLLQFQMHCFATCTHDFWCLLECNSTAFKSLIAYLLEEVGRELIARLWHETGQAAMEWTTAKNDFLQKTLGDIEAYLVTLNDSPDDASLKVSSPILTLWK